MKSCTKKVVYHSLKWPLYATESHENPFIHSIHWFRFRSKQTETVTWTTKVHHARQMKKRKFIPESIKEEHDGHRLRFYWGGNRRKTWFNRIPSQKRFCNICAPAWVWCAPCGLNNLPWKLVMIKHCTSRPGTRDFTFKWSGLDIWGWRGISTRHLRTAGELIKLAEIVYSSSTAWFGIVFVG